MIDESARPEDCGNRAISLRNRLRRNRGPGAIESEGGKDGQIFTNRKSPRSWLSAPTPSLLHTPSARDRGCRAWLCRNEAASVVQDATRLNRSHPADKPND